MTNTDLAVVPGGGSGITHRARADFDPGQVELIRATVAKECNVAELAYFLEVCAKYDLDPFAKQVWAMKIKGAVQIVVSRDGLLSLANRHTPAQGFSGSGEFLGCESDVVREHDFFRKYRGPRGTEVEHEYRDAQGQPTASKAKRGPIIGAWAIVHRREHTPTFFFAEWDTYNTGQNVWRSHPEAMMQKVPESMALRKAFSVGGVIGESEVPRQDITATPDGEPDQGGGEIEWGEDEALAEELKTLFRALGYRRAKVRLMLRGKTDDERRAIANQLQGELDEQAQAEPVHDAEVVS